MATGGTSADGNVCFSGCLLPSPVAGVIWAAATADGRCTGGCCWSMGRLALSEGNWAGSMGSLAGFKGTLAFEPIATARGRIDMEMAGLSFPGRLA